MASERVTRRHRYESLHATGIVLCFCEISAGNLYFITPALRDGPPPSPWLKISAVYRVADGLKVNQPGTTYPSFNITGGPENTHLKGMGLIRVTPKTHLQIITGIKTAALRFVQCLVSRFCAAQLDKWRWTSLK